MKKLLAVALIICSLESSAIAETDQFLEDFNIYAQSLYGLQTIEKIYSDPVMAAYKSDDIEIMYENDNYTVYGTEDQEVITAACCVMRAIDNQGSMIDQYGRIMNAYFLCKANGKESIATTENHVMILVDKENGVLSIRMVK